MGIVSPLFAGVEIGGVEYISVAELARLCGMRYRTIEAGKCQRVYSKYTNMDFRVNRRDFRLNGKLLWLGSAVALRKGLLFVSKRDYYKTIMPILFPQNCGVPRKVRTIVIDAGHGGKDTGTQNRKLKLLEKSVVLDMALRLG